LSTITLYLRYQGERIVKIVEDDLDLGAGKKGFIVVSPVRLDELEALGYLLAIVDLEETPSLLRLPFDGTIIFFPLGGQTSFSKLFGG